MPKLCNEDRKNIIDLALYEGHNFSGEKLHVFSKITF